MNRKGVLYMLASSAVAFTLMSCAAQAQEEEKRKANFVVFFCDDLGYADIGCFGAKKKTPHIDCTPTNPASRAAIQGRRQKEFPSSNPLPPEP